MEAAIAWSEAVELPSPGEEGEVACEMEVQTELTTGDSPLCNAGDPQLELTLEPNEAEKSLPITNLASPTAPPELSSHRLGAAGLVPGVELQLVEAEEVVTMTAGTTGLEESCSAPSREETLLSMESAASMCQTGGVECKAEGEELILVETEEAVLVEAEEAMLGLVEEEIVTESRDLPDALCGKGSNSVVAVVEENELPPAGGVLTSEGYFVPDQVEVEVSDSKLVESRKLRNRLKKQRQRKNPAFRQKEKELAKERMKNLRQNEDYRSKERQRDRERKKQARLHRSSPCSKVHLVCSKQQVSASVADTETEPCPPSSPPHLPPPPSPPPPFPCPPSLWGFAYSCAVLVLAVHTL